MVEVKYELLVNSLGEKVKAKYKEKVPAVGKSISPRDHTYPHYTK
jgi:hypothetical protein